MRRDPSVFLLGEEVGQYQGAYKITQGMVRSSASGACATRRSPRRRSPASPWARPSWACARSPR